MNTDDINPRPGEQEPQAPPRLAAALKEPSPRRVFVPPVVDEAILRAARRHLEGNARRSEPGNFFRSWFARFATATAGVALAALLYFATRHGGSQFVREDVNHDGRVDILDAFQLQRELLAGKAPIELDLNGDGVVDRRDVELIAVTAVKLEKGRRS